MSKQLFQEGDTLTQGDQKLECIFVSWRERDGEKENFVYSFRLQSEVEAEREATSNPTTTEGEQ